MLFDPNLSIVHPRVHPIKENKVFRDFSTQLKDKKLVIL